MSRQAARENTNYVTILGSEGNFRLQVSEDTEGAIAREYTDKDEKPAVKYELVFEEISGVLKGIRLFEGDYGTNVIVDLEHEDGVDSISFNTNTNFGEDVLKKLPNLDYEKLMSGEEEISFRPFKFFGNNGKEIRGVTILTGDPSVPQKDRAKEWTKHTNFFIDDDKNPINGLEGIKEPKANKDGKVSKDKWRAFFQEVRIFMLEYTEENIIPKFESTQPEEAGETAEEDEFDSLPTNDQK